METSRSSERAERALRRASPSPSEGTPAPKRQKTRTRVLLDTGDGGELELSTDERTQTVDAAALVPEHGSTVGETVRAAAQGPASSAPRSITHGQLDTINLEEEAEEVPRPGSGQGPPAGQAAPGQGAPPPPASAPGGATPSVALAVTPATREVFRGYRQERKMRLPAFKGLDGQTPISTWLRAVQTETRRQERSLGVHWDSNAVYYEMASHLEGEALRWYGNIMGTIINETDDNLARLLRERYGEQRSDPEVVGSLNDRKQMRGEPLVERNGIRPARVSDTAGILPAARIFGTPRVHLVPLGASTGSQTANSKFQTGAGVNTAAQNARSRTPGYEGGGNRRTGKINQVEAGQNNNAPLGTRGNGRESEERRQRPDHEAHTPAREEKETRTEPRSTEQNDVETGDGAEAACDAASQERAPEVPDRMSAAGDGAGAGRGQTTSSPATPARTTKKKSANNARKEKEASVEQAADMKEKTATGRGLMKYTGRLPRRQREVTQVMRVEGPVSTQRCPSTAMETTEGSPAALRKEFMAEEAKRGTGQARMFREGVMNDETKQLEAQEKERGSARVAKRRERAQRRRARREKQQGQQGPRGITVQDVRHASSARAVGPGEEVTDSDMGPGVTAEQNFNMPEPSDQFVEALKWSVRAHAATREVKKRRDTLVDGFANLAMPEARRLELLAAGNVAGENDTRQSVAQQILAAAAGLKAIGADEWRDDDDTPVKVSRARRRYQKKVMKGRTKALRRWKRQVVSGHCLEGTFNAMRDMQRHGVENARRLTEEEVEAATLVLPHATDSLKKSARQKKMRRCYEYRSGSIYEPPCVKALDGLPQPVRVAKLRAARAEMMDLLPTATMEIKGEWKPVKIDTGAQYSVAGECWAPYGVKLDVPPPVDFMEGFSGTAVKVLGVWRFLFRTLYQQVLQVDALLVESATSDFLLGEDWMYRHGVKIDFTSSEMKWYTDDANVVVPFTGIGARSQQPTRMAKVRLIRQTKVITQTLHNVKLAVEAPDGSLGLFMPRPRAEEHLLLAPTLAKVCNGSIRVPVLSLAGRTTKLPSREILGMWVPSNEEMEVLEMTGELDREKVKSWLASILGAQAEPLSNEEDLELGDMGDEDKGLMLNLLRRYPALLEPRKGCPPGTTLDIEHVIHTGNEAPIKVRARRHAQLEHEVIDKALDEMLDGGVVEEGHGAWGFPVVLVRKKDGSVRFCIDYRILNAITKKDVYPLPRIDETLESMHGARRLSSLDMHAGYWQVPVAAKARDKTAFVTRGGLFRFVRMPFGLANAPGTFQRMMDTTLRGMGWQCCLGYLDDVIIFTKGDVARHVVELAAVLERLSRAGLSLKASKCSFGTTRLEYLGHELDSDGNRPMDSLVTSVNDFSIPEDEKAVKRFVHLAGFIDAYPDFSKPFKLVTDASAVGLGAALMQDQGRREQPIAFASKVNSPTVAKYGITDLECAAVVWAIKLFRPYLYGRRFTLITDHNALSWLMKSKDLTGRLHRWALQLQEYDFNVTYRPGSTNVVADALSRAPVLQVAPGQTNDTGATAEEAAEGQLTDEEIRREQQQDRQVQRLLEAKCHGAVEIVNDGGLVYAITREGGAARHLETQGIERGARFYLRVSSASATDAHTNCGDLLVARLGLGFVGDRWALDVAGPLPLTARGNRYVIAAVEYATRYAIAVAVPTHTANDVARFIMERVILVHGTLRELVMDGAPELNGRVIEELVSMLQARQVTPVPYRPALLGLVERFHRSWQDMVSMYVAENQEDWDDWVPCAQYAYNGARHSTTGYSPNEPRMGRRLRAPNELLRASGVTQIGTWADYHQKLVKHMAVAKEIAQRAAALDQDRRARYYNHRVRSNVRFKAGDLVWVLRPPRGRGVTKLAHQWIGPAKVDEEAGFDNLRVTRLDTGDSMLVHCSFLTSYHCPESHSEEIARRETEACDGDEHEPDVWRHQVARTEVSGGSGGQVEDEDGNAFGAVRPDPQATATRSRPEQTAGGRTASQPSENEGTQIREGRRHARRVVRVREETERHEPPVSRSIIDAVATAKPTDTAAVRQPGGERTAVAREQELAAPQLQEEVHRVEREARAARRSARRDQQEIPATQADGPVATERLHSSGVPGTEPPGQTSQHIGSDTEVVEEEHGAVQRGRKRRRNRAGRYELEYEIEYRTSADAPVQRKWLGIKEYGVLLDQGELEDELSGDGE
ncbi:unnamed protein product [Phytophthora fragariaefolia]|uniref:RNA-directed DNA polymerase n=1 Tax=Phytophthora fragariaefolia TaxID=1490495 RepID=A0A9W6X3E3_9STRA|nr:unnamed protein product [Phytophthora fragariaefolia]